MKVIDFLDANCKNCYKCVRHCSVKAIKVRDGQAQILNEQCILCGHCLEVCPQNAKTFISDLSRVKKYLAAKEKVIISIAPSYLGILEYDHPGQVVDALHRLGFYQVRETAEGAAMVTGAYQALLQDGTLENMITTCCPSVNDLVEKYYPDLTPYLAPVVSPMIAHGKLIKQLYPDSKVVFLGPCIAKKEEAEGDSRTKGYIDAVINFTELEQWLLEEGITISLCDRVPMDNPNPGINRLYPVSGGVVTSVMLDKSPDKTYHKIYVDGIENVIDVLNGMRQGEIKHYFIEANVCEGGCIKGPAIDKLGVSRFKARVIIEDQVEHIPACCEESCSSILLDKSFYPRPVTEHMPSEEEIQTILHSTGKYTKEQELNCGACGYSSCREKAIAVAQGKAEIDMCLPYACEKARSMANIVMEATPNMILIVDGDMRICELNKKAEDVLQIKKPEALEHYLFEYLDHSDALSVYDSHQPILHKKVALENLHMTAMLICVYVKDSDYVLCIFQDITDQEEKKLKHYNLKMETVEMAQKVIDKQMMVAQEIASLLGETTAETKVTLSKLRDSILFEDEE
ncbi:MAG: [Fe-Fe] hydrogenase large subunit C-terminal domain-containing protein [Lachnospiraceae bacterium]|nr:[Fe-Fe] hydrogenase large subunit C-terminal domain-containing protein [Lachnospiraceae bacterium]